MDGVRCRSWRRWPYVLRPTPVSMPAHGENQTTHCQVWRTAIISVACIYNILVVWFQCSNRYSQVILLFFTICLQHFVSRVKITNVILQPDILINQAMLHMQQSITKRIELVKILTTVVDINDLL